MTFLTLLAACSAGVASHIVYFHRSECHMHATKYINALLLVFVGSILILIKANNSSLASAIGTTTAPILSYLAGLYTSLLTYRLLLNPLNRFPGPYAARISSLWWSFQLGKSDGYLKLKALHDRYGPIVRIGSSDLSIIDPAFMEPTFGLNAVSSKSYWYDNDRPYSSMHTTRSRAFHDKRRKIWAPAFSDKALRDYETTIERYNETLIQRIADFHGGPVNVRKWFNLWSFDVMGQLAFGKDYGMLESGEKHAALALLSEGMQPLALMLPTWMFRILTQIPFLGAGFQKFVKFCIQELSWRVENADAVAKGKEGRLDIMGWILKAYQGVDKPQRETLLQADTRLIIVAGYERFFHECEDMVLKLLTSPPRSDTTAAAMTCLFYHLAQHSEHIQKIRAEIKPLMKGDWSDKDIRGAEHLNGAINEALRLHPPVPSGLFRIAPPEGLRVGETFIPGLTTYLMPSYVMGRDEHNYTSATSFMPERWYSRPDMIKHKDAYAPFSIGPMGCIGKNLALTELRTLTARLVRDFDVSFAKGEDGKRMLTETLDHFTVDPGDLELVFAKV